LVVIRSIVQVLPGFGAVGKIQLHSLVGVLQVCGAEQLPVGDLLLVSLQQQLAHLASPSKLVRQVVRHISEGVVPLLKDELALQGRRE
jgi:hypothetical protein